MSDTRCVESEDEQEDRGDSVAQPREQRVREQSSVKDDPFSKDPLEREIAPLDFSPNSTATTAEDARQDLGTAFQTGRHAYTENATYIPENIPAQSNKWRTLNDINRETVHDEDDHVESARRRHDRRTDIRTWGTQIGLTDPEIVRAIKIVEATTAGVRRNFGIETVILGALTLAANESATNATVAKSIRLDGPSTHNPDLVEQYESIRENLSVSSVRVSQFRSWYQNNHSP